MVQVGIAILVKVFLGCCGSGMGGCTSYIYPEKQKRGFTKDTSLLLSSLLIFATCITYKDKMLKKIGWFCYEKR